MEVNFPVQVLQHILAYLLKLPMVKFREFGRESITAQGFDLCSCQYLKHFQKGDHSFQLVIRTNFAHPFDHLPFLLPSNGKAYPRSLEKALYRFKQALIEEAGTQKIVTEMNDNNPHLVPGKILNVEIVRQIRADEHQVNRLKRTDIVPNHPMAGAVQHECKLILRVKMPRTTE